MSVSEDRRIAVLEAATHHWGRDVAVTLMEMLPPSGWGDVATRQQLDALRRELLGQLDREVGALRGEIGALRVELQSEIALLRAELHAEMALLRAEVHAEIADGQRRFLQWTIATVIAMASLSTAVAALVR